jgi:hypothetical protein
MRREALVRARRRLSPAKSAFRKGVHFSRGTIGEFYPMVASRTRGDGDRPRARSALAAGVEAGGHSRAVGILPRGIGPQCIRVKAPLRLDQPGSRGELLVPEGTEPVGRTAHRRPSEDSAVNSSTTRGAKALVSEIDRRRYRTATGVHRWVSGRFLLRSAEIAGMGPA